MAQQDFPVKVAYLKHLTSYCSPVPPTIFREHIPFILYAPTNKDHWYEKIFWRA